MKTQKSRKILQLTADKKYSVVEISEVRKQKRQLQFFSVGLATEIGYSIAIPITLGALIGVWLDKKFNSAPKLTLSLLFVGILLSFIKLFKIVTDITQKGKK